MVITINPRSATGILATAIVVAMIYGTTLNNQALINLVREMFWGVVSLIIIVTLLINLPRILRVLMMFF